MFAISSHGQGYSQYFDGPDNSGFGQIPYTIDSGANNIWQVGYPFKAAFEYSPISGRNAIVTDTVKPYPPNNKSSFILKVPVFKPYGIYALQWVQRFDFDSTGDGGLVEYSIDTAKTWQSVFDNPYVYNFYGFNTNNVGTLLSGQTGFAGKDTSVQDVWLCFGYSWLYNSKLDTLLIRFTFMSDSINNPRAGWMIDNIMSRITMIHTIKNVVMKDYLKLYPNPSNGRVYIEAENLLEFHIIETMELIDAQGIIVERWNNIPTKFWFETNKYAVGKYMVRIKTNKKTETLPLVISRQ